MAKILHIGLGGLGKSTVVNYLVNQTFENDANVAVVDYRCDGIDKRINRLEVGKIDTLYERRALRQLMRGYECCIVVCGLGGKCTSEYLPLIVALSLEVKCRLEVYATTPFRFERKRCYEAINVLRRLKSNRVPYHLLHNQQLLNHPLIVHNGISEIFDLWLEFLRKRV